MQATTGTPLSDEAASASGRSRGDRRLLSVWLGVALLAYVLDQLTKWWAASNLTEGVPRDLVGGLLRLNLTSNTGAAFSIGTGYTIFLTLVALTVVLVTIRVARRLGSLGWAVALGLLLGGAVGNLTDRVFRAPAPLRGHVIDFLELPHWPVFNVADASICIAAVLVGILTVRGIRFDGTRDRRVADGS